MTQQLKETIADYGIDEALKACAELIGEGYLENSYETNYIPDLVRENLSHYREVLLHHQIIPSRKTRRSRNKRSTGTASRR